MAGVDSQRRGDRIGTIEDKPYLPGLPGWRVAAANEWAEERERRIARKNRE